MTEKTKLFTQLKLGSILKWHSVQACLGIVVRFDQVHDRIDINWTSTTVDRNDILSYTRGYSFDLVKDWCKREVITILG
jgi:hypothetical protein